MKNKTIVESTTPPSNTNTLWLDMSDKNKTLKVFNNGKWEEINNTTTRLSDVLDTSEKAINQALMDNLSYGIRWRSGDVKSVVTVGNDYIRRENPITMYLTLALNTENVFKCSLQNNPYILYSTDSSIIFIPDYISEDEALKDRYFNGFGRIQLLTKDDKLYIKDYINNSTTTMLSSIVDKITKDTKKLNSVSSIYILNTLYNLGKVIVDTDGKPMAEATVDEESPALPDGVYSCYVDTYIVRPTSMLRIYWKHIIVCPLFYIKSFEDNGYKEIRVSRYKIDDTWTELRRCIIYPTIFPYDNNRGGILLSAAIRDVNDINNMLLEETPVINLFTYNTMNYCEFSRIFLSLLFINRGMIAKTIEYPFYLGNHAILKGIYFTSNSVKVVEEDGTSKTIRGTLYDDSKSNYIKDYYLIDNGILVPLSGGGTKNNYIGIIENDGYANIQQEDTDESTILTIIDSSKGLKFLFSNTDYPILDNSDSNASSYLGTGLINIDYV